MPTPSEHLLNNRYETLAEWARGGQGRVFLAHDRDTGNSVALKVWDITSADDRRAYETEASLIEGIGSHPHLPVFVDRFVEGHRGVLVTDWVEGVTLERTLADDGCPGLPPSLVVAYLEQVAGALDHLHSADPPRVHGDVKPENMILTAGGSVVLVDFGCADPLDMQGTPGFVAPELASGQPKSASSDVYAVAVTAITLITGTVPSDVPVPETVDATTTCALISGLRAALTPDPKTRTSTAGEVIGHLRTTLGEEACSARRWVAGRGSPAAGRSGATAHRPPYRCRCSSTIGVRRPTSGTGTSWTSWTCSTAPLVKRDAVSPSSPANPGRARHAQHRNWPGRPWPAGRSCCTASAGPRVRCPTSPSPRR